MASELQLNQYKHKLYPNGARYIDTDQFDIRTPFQERGTVVGYVGRFEEGKGVKTLAEAVPQLPNDIVGRFTGDGPLAEELTADLAAEIEQSRVEMNGWVDHEDVPVELNRLQLLVLPSESEGLPTIVLEALACGTPVYATPVSGVPDVVQDGKTGFLNPNIDATTLAQDIERILYEEPLGEISENGRSLIEKEYSLKAATGRYRSILVEIGYSPNEVS
jgi:glycosyltransferase involved in cell wall biosynthesis